jgi:CHAT domain-containing protein
MSEARDDFEFRSKWATTIDEMMRHLNELRPTVIHFSGHGGNNASASQRGMHSSRDIDCARIAENCSGLCLQDERGNPQWVTAHGMTMMLKAAAASARVVVLNACYSDLQASALRTVVDCVVGMTGAIDDEAARAFAVGFYRALGNRRSVGNAVEQAVATLAAKQLTDENLPRCRTRKGVDASKLFLCDVDGNSPRWWRPEARDARAAARPARSQAVVALAIMVPMLCWSYPLPLGFTCAVCVFAALFVLRRDHVMP